MVRRAFPLAIQLESRAHRVQQCLWFPYVALPQTSSLAPGLFKGETAFAQVSPRLALPGKVATHSHGGEQTLQRQSGSGLTFSRLSLCVGFGLHLSLQMAG